MEVTFPEMGQVIEKIVSIEGEIGSGKTFLTKKIANEIGINCILEEYDKNPFLSGFYEKTGVDFENELTFLLLHYNQLHLRTKQTADRLLLADFSIEKDMIFAKESLRETELEIFEMVYNYAISQVGLPELTIFLDVSSDKIWKQVNQRGRNYEINAGRNFIERYNNRLKDHFLHADKSRVLYLYDEELSSESDNSILKSVKDRIFTILGND